MLLLLLLLLLQALTACQRGAQDVTAQWLRAMHAAQKARALELETLAARTRAEARAK
ncbi:MAG: hypothetical protein ACK41Y_16430 [Paracoccus hibiscisoli]|uniref:hypothetical protein n=1 Tax=Paracoccus hibiscisoli TaxID=2023261 RepID=UPI00391DBDF7